MKKNILLLIFIQLIFSQSFSGFSFSGAKSMGTANPHNVIRACLKALTKQHSPKHISLIRSKKISEIIEKRG